MALKNRQEGLWEYGAEDAIVLGALAALALWLFVGLPFLYWFSARDHQQKVDMATSVSSVLIGFLGGSLMTWIITRIHGWWTRPILAARLVEGRGCYVKTARGIPPTHEAWFLRVIIENRGLSTAHNCKGYVTGVMQSVNGMSNPKPQEVLEPTWSSGNDTTAPRSIPPGAFFYMNVASLDLVKQGPPELRFCVPWTPNHYADLFGHAATFELQIKIVADNAKPTDRTVRFDFDPQWQNLHFQYD